MNYLPPQRSSSRFHMPVPPAQGTPYRPPFPQSRSLPDDSASVSSDQTLQIPDSQAEMLAFAKAEVGEALRSFAQCTQMQGNQIIQCIQEMEGVDTKGLSAWQVSLDKAIQNLPLMAEGVSQKVAGTQEGLHEQMTQVQMEIFQGLKGLETAIERMTNSIRRDNGAMNTQLQNIEKRIKRKRHYAKKRGHRKEKFYAPGILWPVRPPPSQWCDCILKAGKRLTRTERIKGIEEGRLVCTCRLS